MSEFAVSGGGPGGDEGARRQESAGEGDRFRAALSSSRIEATAATSSDIRASEAGVGMCGKRAWVTFSSVERLVRFRRLADVDSPGGLGTGGAAKEIVVGGRGFGAGCPSGSDVRARMLATVARVRRRSLWPRRAVGSGRITQEVGRAVAVVWFAGTMLGI